MLLEYLRSAIVNTGFYDVLPDENALISYKNK